MYFFDLPGFHPINGVDVDDHGKYPYLHFKDTVFEKDDTNYIDSYFPFKSVAIADGKTVFVSEKNLIAIFKYDPVFRNDLLIDHFRPVSTEQLNTIKEGFYKGYLAGIADFPRQIQSTINLADSPVKEIKLRNFVVFCGDHLFFEGFATSNCLYALGFIQAYLLKAFGEYQNLIQGIEQSFSKEKLNENIPDRVITTEAIQEDEKRETNLIKENILEEVASEDLIQQNEISEAVIPVDPILENEVPKAGVNEENIPEELKSENEDEIPKANLVGEEIDDGDIIRQVAVAQLPIKEVERESFERIRLDYPTDEIISLWMILLEVWKCKPVNSIQVFFEPEEVLELLGSMFDDSASKKMLPQSEHKYFNLPPGKYERIINLLMHVTYKFNTDRNNINLEKYCEVLIGTFSCYSKTKVVSLKSNINKERGNIIKSIKSLSESDCKNDFLRVLEKINEYKTRD